MFLVEKGVDRRTIVSVFRDDGHQQLSYDPLCYPIIFSFGTDGFHLGIPQTQGQRTVTARQFNTYRIMKRGNSFNVRHECSRLNSIW